jgi:TatD DNase family protein
MIPFFDSHCHLTDKKFDVNRESIINEAEKNSLFMITIGTSYEESVKAIELANKYPKNIWATVGIHPEYAREVPENISELLNNLIQNKKVVAIGEGGLDYAQILTLEDGKEIIEKQKKLFQIQLDLALKYDLPIIMHLRNKNGEGNGCDAYKDALNILDELPKMPKGVVHFFQGNLEQAQEFLKRGFYLGFDGYITFDSHYDNIIKEIPLDRILIETDSPYVSPVPFRGKRNEPKFVEYVAEKIAGIKKVDIEYIEKVTYENVRTLFRV